MDSISRETDILRKNIKSWQNLSDDQLDFQRLAGLSNLIWKVTAVADVEPKAIIYRKFGEVSGVLDRDRENYIFNELSKANLGPCLYGTSPDYRIEEFYEHDPVGRLDIRDANTRRAIAKKLARFHNVKISDINQDPFVLKVLRDGVFDADFEKKVSSTEFTVTEDIMLEEITNSVFSEDERGFLIDLLPSSPSSIVFSHNDLHAGNILRLKEKNAFLFIDFEYNDYNYRGFDIANLFNETMFDYSYPEAPFYAVNEQDYPSDSELQDFIRYYVFFTLFPELHENDTEAEEFLKDSDLIDEYLREMGKTREFEEEVEQISYETEVCKLLSHYYWVIWSVIFSKKPEIKFDYISYGLDRLKLYKQAKKELIQKKINITV